MEANNEEANHCQVCGMQFPPCTTHVMMRSHAYKCKGPSAGNFVPTTAFPGDAIDIRQKRKSAVKAMHSFTQGHYGDLDTVEYGDVDDQLEFPMDESGGDDPNFVPDEVMVKIEQQEEEEYDFQEDSNVVEEESPSGDDEDFIEMDDDFQNRRKGRNRKTGEEGGATSGGSSKEFPNDAHSVLTKYLEMQYAWERRLDQRTVRIVYFKHFASQWKTRSEKPDSRLEDRRSLFIPESSAWTPIPENQLLKYLPTERNSMKYRTDSDHHRHLNLFEVDKNEGMWFTGGFVRAMAWNPQPFKDAFQKPQYLAVATYRDVTTVQPYQAVKACMGLVQIWECKHLGIEDSKTPTTRLALGLGHSFGKVMALAWLPPFTAASSHSSQHLGTIVLAATDGIVHLLPVRLPDNPDNSQPTSIFFTSSQWLSLGIPPTAIDPIAVQRFGFPTCVESRPEYPHLVTAGFNTGYVALWSLTTFCPWLEEYKYIPCIRCFRGSNGPVFSVSLDPLNGRNILCSGHERPLKLWHIDDMSQSHISWSQQRAGSCRAFSWAGRGDLVCTVHEDNYGAVQPGVYLQAVHAPQKVSLRVTEHTGAARDCSFSDLLSTLVFSTQEGLISAIPIGRHLYDVRACRDFAKSHPAFTVMNLTLKEFEQPTKSHGQSKGCGRCGQTENYNMCYKCVDAKYFLDFSRRDATVKASLTYHLWQAQAVTRVAFNPNPAACSWIAFGTAGGLVRIERVDKLMYSEMRDFLKCLCNQPEGVAAANLSNFVDQSLAAQQARRASQSGGRGKKKGGGGKEADEEDVQSQDTESTLPACDTLLDFSCPSPGSPPEDKETSIISDDSGSTIPCVEERVEVSSVSLSPTPRQRRSSNSSTNSGKGGKNLKRKSGKGKRKTTIELVMEALRIGAEESPDDDVASQLETGVTSQVGSSETYRSLPESSFTETSVERTNVLERLPSLLSDVGSLDSESDRRKTDTSLNCKSNEPKFSSQAKGKAKNNKRETKKPKEVKLKVVHVERRIKEGSEGELRHLDKSKFEENKCSKDGKDTTKTSIEAVKASVSQKGGSRSSDISPGDMDKPVEERIQVTGKSKEEKRHDERSRIVNKHGKPITSGGAKEVERKTSSEEHEKQGINERQLSEGEKTKDSVDSSSEMKSLGGEVVEESMEEIGSISPQMMNKTKRKRKGQSNTETVGMNLDCSNEIQSEKRENSCDEYGMQMKDDQNAEAVNDTKEEKSKNQKTVEQLNKIIDVDRQENVKEDKKVEVDENETVVQKDMVIDIDEMKKMAIDEKNKIEEKTVTEIISREEREIEVEKVEEPVKKSSHRNKSEKNSGKEEETDRHLIDKKGENPMEGNVEMNEDETKSEIKRNEKKVLSSNDEKEENVKANERKEEIQEDRTGLEMKDMQSKERKEMKPGETEGEKGVEVEVDTNKKEIEKVGREEEMKEKVDTEESKKHKMEENIKDDTKEENKANEKNYNIKEESEEESKEQGEKVEIKDNEEVEVKEGEKKWGIKVSEREAANKVDNRKKETKEEIESKSLSFRPKRIICNANDDDKVNLVVKEKMKVITMESDESHFPHANAKLSGGRLRNVPCKRKRGQLQSLIPQETLSTKLRRTEEKTENSTEVPLLINPTNDVVAAQKHPISSTTGGTELGADTHPEKVVPKRRRGRGNLPWKSLVHVVMPSGVTSPVVMRKVKEEDAKDTEEMSSKSKRGTQSVINTVNTLVAHEETKLETTQKGMNVSDVGVADPVLKTKGDTKSENQDTKIEAGDEAMGSEKDIATRPTLNLHSSTELIVQNLVSSQQEHDSVTKSEVDTLSLDNKKAVAKRGRRSHNQVLESTSSSQAESEESIHGSRDRNLRSGGKPLELDKWREPDSRGSKNSSVPSAAQPSKIAMSGSRIIPKQAGIKRRNMATALKFSQSPQSPKKRARRSRDVINMKTETFISSNRDDLSTSIDIAAEKSPPSTEVMEIASILSVAIDSHQVSAEKYFKKKGRASVCKTEQGEDEADSNTDRKEKLKKKGLNSGGGNNNKEKDEVGNLKTSSVNRHTRKSVTSVDSERLPDPITETVQEKEETLDTTVLTETVKCEVGDSVEVSDQIALNASIDDNPGKPIEITCCGSAKAEHEGNELDNENVTDLSATNTDKRRTRKGRPSIETKKIANESPNVENLETKSDEVRKRRRGRSGAVNKKECVNDSKGDTVNVKVEEQADTHDVNEKIKIVVDTIEDDEHSSEVKQAENEDITDHTPLPNEDLSEKPCEGGKIEGRQLRRRPQSLDPIKEETEVKKVELEDVCSRKESTKLRRGRSDIYEMKDELKKKSDSIEGERQAGIEVKQAENEDITDHTPLPNEDLSEKPCEGGKIEGRQLRRRPQSLEPIKKEIEVKKVELEDESPREESTKLRRGRSDIYEIKDELKKKSDSIEGERQAGIEVKQAENEDITDHTPLPNEDLSEKPCEGGKIEGRQLRRRPQSLEPIKKEIEVKKVELEDESPREESTKLRRGRSDIYEIKDELKKKSDSIEGERQAGIEVKQAENEDITDHTPLPNEDLSEKPCEGGKIEGRQLRRRPQSLEPIKKEIEVKKVELEDETPREESTKLRRGRSSLTQKNIVKDDKKVTSNSKQMEEVVPQQLTAEPQAEEHHLKIESQKFEATKIPPEDEKTIGRTMRRRRQSLDTKQDLTETSKDKVIKKETVDDLIEENSAEKEIRMPRRGRSAVKSDPTCDSVESNTKVLSQHDNCKVKIKELEVVGYVNRRLEMNLKRIDVSCTKDMEQDKKENENTAEIERESFDKLSKEEILSSTEEKSHERKSRRSLPVTSKRKQPKNIKEEDSSMGDLQVVVQKLEGNDVQEVKERLGHGIENSGEVHKANKIEESDQFITNTEENNPEMLSTKNRGSGAARRKRRQRSVTEAETETSVVSENTQKIGETSAAELLSKQSACQTNTPGMLLRSPPLINRKLTPLTVDVTSMSESVTPPQPPRRSASKRTPSVDKTGEGRHIRRRRGSKSHDPGTPSITSDSDAVESPALRTRTGSKASVSSVKMPEDTPTASSLIEDSDAGETPNLRPRIRTSETNATSSTVEFMSDLDATRTSPEAVDTKTRIPRPIRHLTVEWMEGIWHGVQQPIPLSHIKGDPVEGGIVHVRWPRRSSKRTWAARVISVSVQARSRSSSNASNTEQETQAVVETEESSIRKRTSPNVDDSSEEILPQKKRPRPRESSGNSSLSSKKTVVKSVVKESNTKDGTSPKTSKKTTGKKS